MERGWLSKNLRIIDGRATMVGLIIIGVIIVAIGISLRRFSIATDGNSVLLFQMWKFTLVVWPFISNM